jgi:hypothetical protein
MTTSFEAEQGEDKELMKADDDETVSEDDGDDAGDS